MKAPEIGTRVEVGTPATGPQTGIGRRGVVVARREQQSSATGRVLRWIEVDVRLDSGALVTCEPRCLRVTKRGPIAFSHDDDRFKPRANQ